MVADAVVYHPTVAHYLKFIATTVGRDKFLRTLQYWARFYAWYLYRTNNAQAKVAQYDAVKKNFGMARKLLRLGKFVEHFKAAAVAADSKGSDAVLKYCTIGRQLGYAGYMAMDNLTVPDVVGFRKSPNTKKIQEQAYRAWTAGLLFSVVAGVYQLAQLRKRSGAVDEKEAESVVEKKKIQKEGNAAKIQLISDLCDLAVPLSALGYVTLDDGIVGLSGTVSSLLGLWSVWKKTA
ncbi:Peroxisomal membrane protein PMP27 [Lasiodiplodia hormozganensis]|uniref:Peroxisomal membrane protein PMP27 n=2 Tax=Lasiodiplodia TaxID=66739 RepID=A0A5N5D884_9PEZI|nr:Peroxisomal biogenesis factor 11 [Lasiodiplodia theobromae]KAB2573861.1 Peroxisomal membrane protein PMP27 [Lasiodiplodia theobromae]KAF4541233.1 Peroxisomal biogenesis factor 11 [Lasiodiplodia theobromae]KAK0654215.1 Peroxisomal membrane protein PMP27 [Lasiodiplodia hormozganensis]